MNQRENQKPFISKGQTIQWPKENEPKGESEAFSSVKDRQHNGQKKMNQRENQKPFHQRRTDNTMAKRK